MNAPTDRIDVEILYRTEPGGELRELPPAKTDLVGRAGYVIRELEDWSRELGCLAGCEAQATEALRLANLLRESLAVQPVQPDHDVIPLSWAN